MCAATSNNNRKRGVILPQNGTTTTNHINRAIKTIMPSLGNLFEFDYTNEKPKITIVNFCDEYCYTLFGSKKKQVLLKLNTKTIKKLKTKLNKKEARVKKNEHIYAKFRAILKQIKKINYSIELLMEKKIKLSMFPANKDEIKLYEQKIMFFYEQKKQLQTDLIIWTDFLIEDDMI